MNNVLEDSLFVSQTKKFDEIQSIVRQFSAEYVGNSIIKDNMELPEYEFFCHAQIVTELNRYNADAPIWLSEKIGAQKIKSYTDQEILESLSLVRGPLACATYTQMLKLACDAFSKDYFSEHYRVLEEADYTVISREDYLKELERLDIEVGKKNNLGEIKSFVLLQVLSVMLGEQIYVFCSDDKNARNGATNFEDVRCISLVSVFSRLKEESNLTLADAEPYIESLIAFYQDHHQTTFRVMEASEVRRLQRIPCRQVLQEIFDGITGIFCISGHQFIFNAAETNHYIACASDAFCLFWSCHSVILLRFYNCEATPDKP